MPQKEFPILEFDDSRDVFITPSVRYKPIDIPDRCVLCFFPDAMEIILADYPHTIIAGLKYGSLRLPVYAIDYKGATLTLVQAAEGAPLAARQIDELTALGCNKYMACGSCGVLQKDIAVGHLIIPASAVRDEGTSYHYIQPSREIAADAHVVRVIQTTLEEQNVPYTKAKTWTTDAVYRETPQKVRQRVAEGCLTVEMEASALMAVSRYNSVQFGQILYAGDSLAGEKWDERDFSSRTDVRAFVLRLALDACLRI